MDSRPYSVWLGVWSLALLSTASAGPLSSCVLTNGGAGMTCHIYEEDGNGAPSEISAVVNLPLAFSPSPFYLYLVETPGPDLSDLVLFTAQTVRLFSDGCNLGIEGDQSCWPVPGQGDTAAITFEDSSGPTIFTDGLNIFYIHSDPSPDVPEPSLGGLVCVALGAGGWWHLRQRRRA